MKPVLFQFQRFTSKLPPINKPLLIIDIAGRLWSGTYHGKGRIYDHDRQRSTNRKGYGLNIRTINDHLANYNEVREPSEFAYWVEVPAKL